MVIKIFCDRCGMELKKIEVVIIPTYCKKCKTLKEKLVKKFNNQEI